MFDTLTQGLQKVFRNLRGYGALTDKNIQDALREVRLALLEADVNFQVAKDFIQRVREQCLGEEVLHSVTPGQQVIKRVHDELVNLLGGTHRDLDLSHPPAQVLMLGLHGAGKTTTSAKLAQRLKQGGRRVLLAACDIRRPAAVDQLRILAGQVGVELLAPAAGETVPALGRRALEEAAARNLDTIIYDTGGRFQVDAELVQELKDLRAAVKPRNVLLVLDAAIGQEAVRVAETFHKEVGLTGLVLTKLDGDARGGAALSVQAVTGCPILMVGSGERLADLEPFYPDRMAARILGMGDVVSFVEKAQAAMATDDMVDMQERLLKDNFSLEDFLAQMRQLKKLGPLERLMDMIPGAGQIPAAAREQMAAGSGDEMKKVEAIILSMTAKERRRPDLINASRKRRIAAGSGTDVSDVNQLLRTFDQARKMMKKMKKWQRRAQ